MAPPARLAPVETQAWQHMGMAGQRGWNDASPIAMATGEKKQVLGSWRCPLEHAVNAFAVPDRVGRRSRMTEHRGPSMGTPIGSEKQKFLSLHVKISLR